MSVDGPLAIQGDGAAGRHACAGRAGAAVHHAARDRRRTRRDPAGRHRPGRLPRAARDRDHRPPGARSQPRCRRQRARARRRRSLLAPPLDRFVAGTWRASASFGGAVRYDVGGLVQALDRLSAVLPGAGDQPRLPAGAAAGRPAGRRRIAPARLQQSVGLVLDRQRFDGGFGLWSATARRSRGCRPTRPSSCCARAGAGAAVPDQALADALKFIAGAADEPRRQAGRPRRAGLSALCAGRWPARAARARRA